MRAAFIGLWLIGCASAVPAGSPDGGGPGGNKDLGSARDMTMVDAKSPADLAMPDLREPVDMTPPPDLLSCLDGGATCMTGNPGACAFGVPLCTGASRVCATVVGSQPCYDGPNGTLGVGVCQSGSQSCVGSLGACMNEVVPAAQENCYNDSDDDCDGRLNNGCPDTVYVGTPYDLTARGGPGGGANPARCPSGSFVTHVKTWWDNTNGHASGVSIWCATPTLVRNASSYTVSLTPVNPQPYVAAMGGIATDFGDDVDCGTSGFTAAYETYAQTDGTYVFGIGMGCANGSATLNADNTLSVSFTGNGTWNYWDYTGGTGYWDACNYNEVLVGFDLRTGSWMDAMTAVCAPILVTYK
jgi:hypothetical protein